jgi:hypothetical protein
MTRRLAAVVALVVVLVVGGGNAALAKKHKKKIAVGNYPGQTLPDGQPISITVNPGRVSGSITYCALTAQFTITGTAFSVAYQDPVSADTITASGFFNKKKKTVSGQVAPNGCTATPQTFFLKH